MSGEDKVLIVLALVLVIGAGIGWLHEIREVNFSCNKQLECEKE